VFLCGKIIIPFLENTNELYWQDVDHDQYVAEVCVNARKLEKPKSLASL